MRPISEKSAKILEMVSPPADKQAVDRALTAFLPSQPARSVRQPLAGHAEFFLSPSQLPKKRREESINARVAIRRAVNQRPEEALRRF